MTPDPPPQTLTLPPFPPLAWAEFFWEAEIVLPSWAGFQSRRGPYNGQSSDAPADGGATLHVRPPDEDARRPPGPEQAAAFRWLMEHEGRVQRAVLDAVFRAYPELREGVTFGDDELDARWLPAIERPEELRRLMGLSHVHVHDIARDGVAYVGYELGCTWDDEHGVGVLTHRDRVVAVGQADTSFDEWTAWQDRDADPRSR